MSYTEGTKETNKEIKIEYQWFIDGWDIAPHYDHNQHDLFS
ncbi:hypothetical protein [Paenibacillus sp. KN14-4R]